MEKIYAVMEYDYDGSWTRGVFATRELAERYCIEDQRAKWQELVNRVGATIPGSQQWEFTFDGRTGACSSRLVGQKFYEHPGTFEWWSVQKENAHGLDIVEHEVIAA